MMENPRSEEEKVIKDIRIFLDLKKKLKELNIYYLEILKTFILNCYKPVRVNNFWSNNYIEHNSNDDRNHD